MLNRIRPLAAAVALLCALLSFAFPLAALAAGTVTPAIYQPTQGNGGRGQFTFTIVETSGTTTSEIAIPGVPKCGTIAEVKAKLIAGTGTTIRPRIGDAASFVADSYDQVLVAENTAAQIVEPGSRPYCTATGTLYLRNGPNAGTDNTITTRIIIVEGAQQ